MRRFRRPDGALAKERGLTGKERLFCEALAADAERNQSRAAEKAGYGKPHRVQGSKVVTRGNVQKYLAALTQTAVARAERQTGRTVATLLFRRTGSR